MVIRTFVVLLASTSATSALATPRGAYAAAELYGGADNIVSPLLLVGAPAGSFEVVAGWAFAWDVDTHTVEPGNPLLAVSATRATGSFVLRPALAMSPPTTLYTADADDERATLFAAAALRGNSGFGLFAPGMLSVVPSLTVEWRGASWAASTQLLAAGSLELARGDGVRRRDLALEVIVVGGADVTSHVHAGTRLQGAYVPTLPGDSTQASVAPFVRIRGSRSFIEARVTVALDAPLGVVDGANVWSIALAFGGAL